MKGKKSLVAAKKYSRNEKAVTKNNCQENVLSCNQKKKVPL